MHYPANTFKNPENNRYIPLPIPEGYIIIKSLTVLYDDTDFPLQENDLYYDWKTQSFKNVTHKSSVTGDFFTVDRYDFIIRKK